MHDPKLVEAVSRLIERRIGLHHLSKAFLDAVAESILDQINASGTHWVAPWEPTEAMIAAAHIGHFEPKWLVEEKYTAQRNAYLVKQEAADGA